MTSLHLSRKMQKYGYKGIRGFRYKTIEFYMKDFKLSFSDSEDCMETFANVYPAFFSRKVDNSPIRISSGSQIMTVVSFAAIIAGVAIVTVLLARADRKRI